MIKGVLFDKDGTLFHFTDTWGVWCDRLLTELSPDDPALRQQLAGAIGYDLHQQTFTPGASFISESADQTAMTLSSLLPSMSADEVADVGLGLLDNLPLAPVTDLPLLFAALKDVGLTIGLATNDYESTARKHLSQLAIFDYFDFICGFDSGYGSKPAPGMIYAFCDNTALEPNQVAMVGDSTHDLSAGHAAGVAMTVGVLTGPAVYSELAASAHAVVENISYLPELLREQAEP